MKISGERYFPYINNPVLSPYEPFISYEHWHRYCFATPFVTGKTVLDIASGEGYGSDYLAEQAALVYGVDICPEAVQHASQTYVRDNLCFLQGSAGSIPIPGQHCLDTIVSFETIEHLDAMTQVCFAREVKRLLKAEGVLLMSTPNRIVYNQGESSQNPFHLREFTQEEFVEFLRGYFAHVHLLSQRVYPTSFIWNLQAPSTARSEYQIALDGMRFQPRRTDGRETTYLIAVCSDIAPAQEVNDSLLLDVSEVAFRGVPGRGHWYSSTLYRDGGSGFREGESVHEWILYGPSFTVSYNLDPSIPCRQLRWDPLELRLCQVRLKRVRWHDGAGAGHELDLRQVSSNGDPLEDGVFRFQTSDPMLYLPIAGSVANVVIEGECRVEGEVASIQQLEALLVRRQEELREVQGILQVRDRNLEECQQCLQESETLRALLPVSSPSLRVATRQLARAWLHRVISLARQSLRSHRKSIRRRTASHDVAPQARKAG
jgi:SAM-dependent methyltransferase